MLLLLLLSPLPLSLPASHFGSSEVFLHDADVSSSAHRAIEQNIPAPLWESDPQLFIQYKAILGFLNDFLVLYVLASVRSG